jgi:hypothetical protein
MVSSCRKKTSCVDTCILDAREGWLLYGFRSGLPSFGPNPASEATSDGAADAGYPDLADPAEDAGLDGICRSMTETTDSATD